MTILFKELIIMVIKLENKQRVLALGLKHREAGQMPNSKTGEPIIWSEATLLQYLPLGLTEGEIRKTPIAPEALASVQNALIEVHWGAVVELTIKNRQIIEIEVLMDPLSAFCDE